MPQEYPLQRRTSFMSTGTNSYPSSQPAPQQQQQQQNYPMDSSAANNNPNFQRFYGPVTECKTKVKVAKNVLLLEYRFDDKYCFGADE
jgi:hypothetical protein